MFRYKSGISGILDDRSSFRIQCNPPWLVACRRSIHQWFSEKVKVAWARQKCSAEASGTHLVILGAIRLSVLFKELSIDSFFANATFKALFVVNFSKSRATFHRHRFHTNSAFSNLLVHSFGHSIANFGLNLRIIEIRLGAHGSVVGRFVTWIGWNGSVDSRWQCSSRRFSFGRHLDAGMTTYGNCCLSCWSTSTSWRRWRPWPPSGGRWCWSWIGSSQPE